jgi:hypothetical protein
VNATLDRLAFPVSRQRLYFWVLILGFANVLVDKAVRSAAQVGWWASVGGLFQVSAIVLAAIAVSLILLGQSRESIPATRKDTAVALAVAVCTLLPVGALSRVAVAGAALYFLSSSPRCSAEWRAAAVAASTSAYFVVGPLLLNTFSYEVACVDAWLVAQATGLERHGDLIAMRDNFGWIKIFNACSSIHALSLAVILPVTYSQWFGISNFRLIVGVFLGIAIATAASNVARLSALAEFPSHYDFIHVGWGATAISAATLTIMLLICFLGFERAKT